MIKGDWFPTYSSPLARQPGDQVVQSWDTANKAGADNDFSACTTWLWRGNAHYLLAVDRLRLDFPALKRSVVALAEQHRADAMLIEDAGSGTPLIQELRAGGRLLPIAIKPEGDKLMRLQAQASALEAGSVLLPQAAPWLDDFRAELLQFPHGSHDDQVDSVSQYLEWVKRRAPVDALCALVESRVKREYEATFGPPGTPPWDIFPRGGY